MNTKLGMMWKETVVTSCEVKLKVKFTLEQAIKAQRGVQV